MAKSDHADQAYLAAEAKARVEIDQQLVACGWLVQDRAELDLYAGQGVAVREFIMTDYSIARDMDRQRIPAPRPRSSA